MRRFKAPLSFVGGIRSLGHIVDGAVAPTPAVRGCGSTFFAKDHCIVDLADDVPVPTGWEIISEKLPVAALSASSGIHGQGKRLQAVAVAQAAREAAEAKAREIAAAKALADAEAKAIADALAAEVAKAAAEAQAIVAAEAEAEEAEAKVRADAEAAEAATLIEAPEAPAEPVIEAAPTFVEEEEHFNSENPAPDEVLAALPETDAPPADDDAPKKPAKKRRR